MTAASGSEHVAIRILTMQDSTGENVDMVEEWSWLQQQDVSTTRVATIRALTMQDGTGEKCWCDSMVIMSSCNARI